MDKKLTVSGLTEAFTLEAFIPAKASDALWTAHFTLSEAVFRENNPKGRLPNRETARRLLSTPNPLYTVKKWMLLDGRGNAAASASLSYDTDLSPDYASSRHIGQIHVAVDPARRRRKVATHLLTHLLQAAADMGKDTVRADADNAAGLAFCKHLHGEMIHRENRYRLHLDDANWPLVEQWRAKGRSRFPQTRIETFQECPERDIDEFCRIYTEIINQRPTGEIREDLVTTPESRRIEERHFRTRHMEWHTMISREPDGHISALTDIMYNPQEPHRVHQYFTGVLGKYRGRGLAKRLKAEMLSYIRDRFLEAEYVTTTTAMENQPMRAINKQLGFEPRKTLTMFQWALEDMDRRVARILAAPARVTSPGKGA
ncbi:MAG: GNAT family N-acetyltransferase [Thermodesulfobacteriota bacterium]